MYSPGASKPFARQPGFYQDYFLQATTSSKRLLGIRVAAAIAFLIAGAGLFILGAQPVAAGLFSPPWDKLAHIGTFALIGCAAGVAVDHKDGSELHAVLQARLHWAWPTSSIKFICPEDLRPGPTCWQIPSAQWLAQRCLISPGSQNFVISGIVKNRTYQSHSKFTQPLSKFRYLRNGALVLSGHHQSRSCADSDCVGIRALPG